MAINTNIGPERVEVTLSPIGTVLPQGAATARTAILIATDLASAPLNTPVTVTSLSQFEQTFGDIANMGEVYLNVKGYYDNAGVGTELVVVAVLPSGITGSALEVALNQDDRSIVGSLAKILDDGVLNTSIVLTTYNSATGVAVLNLSGATFANLANARVGDGLKDAEGRTYAITAINGATPSVTIQSGLDAQLTKSSKSVPADGATGLSIVRLYSAGQHSGKTVIQQGDNYGIAVSVTVSADILTTSAFDSYLNDVREGDIITDSASQEFIIIDVLDGNNLQVDREGLTAGAVTIARGLKTKIVQSTFDAGSAQVTISSAPLSASAGEAVFNLADSALYPSNGSLVGKFLKFSDDSQAQISANSIVANNAATISSFAAAISYVASTGVVTLPVASTVITDGAKAGDVLVDSLGKEHVIHEVLTETTVRINKNAASPNPLSGSKISKGLLELALANSADFSAKVAGEAGADTSGVIHAIANSLVFASGTSLESDDYFIMEPAVKAADYIGSEADASGLYALEAVNVINLIAIPGIYDPSVQAALSDYCSITRFDCMALLSIPEFISSAANDKIVLGNLSISSVVDSAQGVVVSFTGSPDLSKVSTYDILQVGASKFTVRAVSDQDDQIVLFQTTGVPLTGAVSVFSPSAVSWKDVIVNKPSTKAAWYYNHLVVANPNGGQAIVDPVLHVAGVMNRIDRNVAIGGVSHAPAGIQNAQLGGIIGLQLDISEKKDGGPLRLAYINRITASAGNGRYVFGGYTAGGNSVTPDEKLIQVMRSLMFIKNSLEPGLIGFIWENNSPVTRQNIANAVLNFLRANAYLFPSGLPENEQFQVELVPPTQTDIDQGLVKITVRCRFNTAIRFIDIDLQFPIPQAEA
jgi:hypothetical protein